MLQELFRIPGIGIPIFGYGLMIVLGFLAALWVTRRLANRSGASGEVFANAALIALVSGIAGARLSHVIENWAIFTRSDLSFWQNFINAINIRQGGLTFFGGLILATPLTILYGVWKGFPLRLGMDIAAIGVVIGLGFGRIGCFLNGCCYGADSNVPWAVEFPYGSPAYQDEWASGDLPKPPPPELVYLAPDGSAQLYPKSQLTPAQKHLAAREHTRPVHPAQLYSSLNAFLIAGVLLGFFTLRPAPGRIFALMLILLGATRYLIELLRTEPAVVWVRGYGLSWSMVISLGLVPIGIVLWMVFGRFGDRSAAGEIKTRKLGA